MQWIHDDRSRIVGDLLGNGDAISREQPANGLKQAGSLKVGVLDVGRLCGEHANDERQVLDVVAIGERESVEGGHQQMQRRNVSGGVAGAARGGEQLLELF